MSESPPPSQVDGWKVVTGVIGLMFWLILIGAFFEELRLGLGVEEWITIGLIVTMVGAGALRGWRTHLSNEAMERAEELAEHSQQLLELLEVEMDGDASQEWQPAALDEKIQELLEQNDAKVRKGDLFDGIRRRLFQKTTDDNESYLIALDEGLRFVRPVPRSGVRFVNRLRLLTFIAVAKRRLLAPDGTVPPEALGQWCALAENWPQLTEAIMLEPAYAVQLRDASMASELEVDADPLERLLARLAPASVGDPALRRFLRDAPHWTDHVLALTTLQPAEGQPYL